MRDAFIAAVRSLSNFAVSTFGAEWSTFLMHLLRRAALALTLCACGSHAGGVSPAPTASEWTGVRDEPAAAEPSPIDGVPKGAWVLHVGDSFVDASFAQNLSPRFRALGARQVVLGKQATYTTSWAYDPDLDRWLAREPSLVLVTLGANEVGNALPEQHAGAVRRLAHRVGAAAPCVWIAPPMWKRDGTGWLQVIHDHCAPCLFFDSDAVLGGLRPDERQRDRIHPNRRGGARWAEAFWGWLEDHRERGAHHWDLVGFERR